MKKLGLALTIVVVLAMASLPALAGVRNINLVPSGTQGVSGSATTISGEIGGSNPYFNVEVNANISTAPAADMVYEAWLVDTEGNAKRYIGTFNGSMLSSRFQFAHWADPWDALAVSLEPAHNQNLMPTTIVAQGNLPGSDVSAANFMTMAVLPQNESFIRQLVMARFNLTSDQTTSLRVQGWDYGQISLVANAAAKCNKPVADISSMLMQGQSWDQIASSCNTTVAALLTPVPMTAVAGFQAEVGAPVMTAPMYYRMFPNGRPVMSLQMWQDLNQRGYSWRDVAIAANISAKTGDNPDDLLRMIRIQGQIWRDVAINRGLNVNRMMDVSQWPFTQATGPMTSSEMQMERERAGMMTTRPMQPAPTETMPPTPPSSGPSY